MEQYKKIISVLCVGGVLAASHDQDVETVQKPRRPLLSIRFP